MGIPKDYVAVCQNRVPLVNIKIAGKWMLIPLKMVLIGIDPYPSNLIYTWSISMEHVFFEYECIYIIIHNKKSGLRNPTTTEFAMEHGPFGYMIHL